MILSSIFAYIRPRKPYRSLTKASRFQDLIKSKTCSKQKAAILGNGGFHIGPRAEAKTLWITLFSAQGDIVEVDHARLSRPAGLKCENQFFHIYEGGQRTSEITQIHSHRLPVGRDFR